MKKEKKPSCLSFYFKGHAPALSIIKGIQEAKKGLSAGEGLGSGLRDDLEDLAVMVDQIQLSLFVHAEGADASSRLQE